MTDEEAKPAADEATANVDPLHPEAALRDAPDHEGALRDPAADLSAPAPAPEVGLPVAPAWRPNYIFLAAVSIVSLVADLGTKWWATSHLDGAEWFDRRVDVIAEHVALVYARNKGGAWGLLQDENELIRRPFFVLISIAAIVFIVSLYRKLTPQQTALKWGLPLVLGGALGNLVDRIRYGHVVDFIDVKGKLIGSLNAIFGSHTDHWPTFNVADIAICVGVGLMAVDMFTSRKAKKAVALPQADEPKPAAPVS